MIRRQQQRRRLPNIANWRCSGVAPARMRLVRVNIGHVARRKCESLWFRCKRNTFGSWMFSIDGLERIVPLAKNTLLRNESPFTKCQQLVLMKKTEWKWGLTNRLLEKKTWEMERAHFKAEEYLGTTDIWIFVKTNILSVLDCSDNFSEILNRH